MLTLKINTQINAVNLHFKELEEDGKKKLLNISKMNEIIEVKRGMK